MGERNHERHGGGGRWLVGAMLAMTVAAMPVTFFVLAAPTVLQGCSKSGPKAPAAPKMPSDWKVLEDTAPSPGDELFMKVQARFLGKIKTLRIVAYEVHGRHIVLNQIEAASPMDGDMIYRILARKKPFIAYWRNGQIIYEFRGPADAMEDIRRGHEALVNASKADEKK